MRLYLRGKFNYFAVSSVGFRERKKLTAFSEVNVITQPKNDITFHCNFTRLCPINK